MISILYTLFLVCIALIAPIISPYEVSEQNLSLQAIEEVFHAQRRSRGDEASAPRTCSADATVESIGDPCARRFGAVEAHTAPQRPAHGIAGADLAQPKTVSGRTRAPRE